jgi:beta-galactosidase
VRVVDASGRQVPAADHLIRFRLEGPGEIVATDNGDPTSFEPFPSHDRTAFNGLCLVIVRGKAGQPGAVTVTARAEGLQVGTATIRISSAEGR